MPVMQSVFGHNEFAVGIEHNEVRIVPSGNSTLVACRNQPVEPGSAAIQRARSSNVNPRRLASVHISGSATERLAMPPHAV